MSNSIVLKTTLTSGVVIREDEKTGMYDVTEMFDSYNKLKMSQTPVSEDGSDNEFKKRRVDKWLDSKGCQELIEKCKSLEISNFLNSEDAENQQLTKEQKKTIENQVIKTTKAKKTKDGWIKSKTMACPILALDAACYLDVDTKYDVYNYYLDGKINERRKVKEQYKLMCEALYSLSKEQSIFPYAVQQINSIVFDRGIGGLWNDETTKEQLQETYKIMVMITELINDGYIDTLSKLRKKFDAMYVKKYGEHKFEPCTTVE